MTTESKVAWGFAAFLATVTILPLIPVAIMVYQALARFARAF